MPCCFAFEAKFRTCIQDSVCSWDMWRFALPTLSHQMGQIIVTVSCHADFRMVFPVTTFLTSGKVAREDKSVHKQTAKSFPHISALTFGLCFSSRSPAFPGCRSPVQPSNAFVSTEAQTPRQTCMWGSRGRVVSGVTDQMTRSPD